MKWNAQWLAMCGCVLAVAGGALLQQADRLPGRERSPSRASSKTSALDSSRQLRTAVPLSSGRATAVLRSVPMSFEPVARRAGALRVPKGGAGAEFVGRAPGMAVLLTRDGITLDARPAGQSADARLMLSFRADGDLQLASGAPEGRRAGLEWSGERRLPGTTNYLIGRDPRNWRTNVPHFASARAMIPAKGAAGRSVREALIEAYGNEGGFEYDVRVPPGADASALRLRMEGARDVRLDANGDLRMSVGTAQVKMLKPVIYAEPQSSTPSDKIHKPRTGTRGPRTRRKSSGSPTARARRQQRSRARKKMRGGNARPTTPKRPSTGAPRKQHRPTRPATPSPSRFTPPARKALDGGYVLYADGTIGFRVGAHDARAAVVIDPSISISYTTFLGGTGSEVASSMALDASGNIYVGGTTTVAATFPEASTATEGPGGGATDFFIAKIDPTKSGAASLLYLTFLGGSGDEAGGLIALDSKGDVALTGTSTSADYPVTDKSALTSGTNDLVVSEIGPAGNTLVFSTIFGGNGAEDAQSTGGIAVDASGDVFVAGDTSSTNLTVTGGAFQPTYGGGTSDGFLAKFTPSATTSTLAYCTYLGIDATAGVSGVALDSAGNAYLSGFTSNPGNSFPAKNAFQATYAGDPQDAFLMKISPLAKGSADLVYATLLGGSGMDEAYAVAVDAPTPPTLPKAYLTGTTSSADFPAGTIAGYQTALPMDATASTANAFLAVIAQDATTGATSLAYSSYIGGRYTDAGEAIFLTAPNAVYISGSATSFDFPWHDNLEPFNGAADAFVAKMDPTSAGSASLVYSTPLGGISPPGVPVTASAAGVVAGLGGDGAMHVYVSGQTTAASFPSGGGPGGGFQMICSSCQASPPAPDAFLVDIAEAAASLPSVYFNAANLNLGTQPVGSTTNPAFGAIYNGGEMPLQISTFGVAGPNAADFSLINASQCANATVQPGQFCSFGVGFVPSMVGPEAATLVFTDNAPGSPQSLELIGAGQGPLASPSPASINFGNQPQGSTSTLQTIILTNTGNQPLTITNALSSDPAEFVVAAPGASGCLNSATVQPGSACVVNVYFAPTSTGAASAQIEFFDNSGGVSGSEQVVPVTGTGTPPSPITYLAPTSVAFATQTVGTTSAPQLVKLSNLGSAGLNISSISIAGANASSFGIVAQGTSPCPTGSSTLAIGASCTVSVTYEPAAAGNQTANLSFTDDAPGSPQTVPLSGNSIQPAIQVSPTTLAFSSQSVGTASASQTITVTNSGSSTLTMNGVSIAGADPADFKESDNCAGKSLGAGTNCQIAVTFAPAASGSRSATVSISDNAAGSPQSVTVSGMATQAAIALSPTSVNFGNQLVQVASSPVAITATNNGTGALQFTAVSITGTNAADFAISSDACVGANVTVAVNSNCTLDVTFTPACVNSSGALSATLVLTDNAPGSPQDISLSGTATGNYCVTGVAPQTVLAGATATYSLAASAVNGYAGSVALSLSGCPPNATCTVPTGVSVAGNATTPFTVLVSTSAGNAAAVNRIRSVPVGFLAVAILAALSMLTPLAFTKKQQRARRALAAAALAAIIAVALAACGASDGGNAGGGDPGTPAGSYSVTLTGSANATQQSTTLNLTVNP